MASVSPNSRGEKHLFFRKLYIASYMLHARCNMRVVQTTLTEEEHKLLEEYARRQAKSIKEVVREAVRSAVEGEVIQEDPIFSSSPASRRTGKRDDGSIRHDRYLYGESA